VSDDLSVYADALIQAGDPRGELIATGLALERAPTGPLKQQHARLLNAEINRVRALGFAKQIAIINWRFGLVDSIHLETRYGDPWFVPLLASDPAFARLRRLEVASSGSVAGGWQPMFEALRAHPLPLRELAILTTRSAAGHNPYALRIGPVAPLLAALPQLELLQLEGQQPELAGLAHPVLRDLKLPFVGATQLPYFSAFQLPALEALVVHTDGDSAGVLAAQLPALRALTLIHDAPPPVALLDELVRIAGQLTYLNVNRLDETWTKPLVARADALAHLELHGRFTRMPTERVASVRAALPNLIVE